MFNLESAVKYASLMHLGQKRKYTGEPYITHPISVMKIVSTVTQDEEMLMAAVLHDTVEDTDATFDDIQALFGPRVMLLVKDLTDVSTPVDGNRAERKALDRQHTANSHKDSKTIKLADLIHNSASILKYDTKFAVVYMYEKQQLLDVLTEGDKTLHGKAQKIVHSYYRNQ